MEDLLQEHSIDYSVVIPVFNGAGSLANLCERIVSFFKSTHYSFEVLLIDDGSTDESWKEIKVLKDKYPNALKGVRLSRNFGQHNATCTGFKLAQGRFVVTMDDDLETNPEDVAKLIEQQKKNDASLVYGSFKKENKAFLRSFLKSGYRLMARIVEGNDKVNGSSLRLLKSDLAKKIEKNATHFVFVDEMCLWYTSHIEFVKVVRNKSTRKKSNYSLLSLFKLTGGVVLYSSITPLRVVKYLGFLFATTNFLLGIYYLVKKFVYGFPIPGYASIVISVLFSTGIIIFILGVIGEYLSKMFRIMNNRPVYAIEEKV